MNKIKSELKTCKNLIEFNDLLSQVRVAQGKKWRFVKEGSKGSVSMNTLKLRFAEIVKDDQVSPTTSIGQAYVRMKALEMQQGSGEGIFGKLRNLVVRWMYNPDEKIKAIIGENQKGFDSLTQAKAFLLNTLSLYQDDASRELFESVSKALDENKRPLFDPIKVEAFLNANPSEVPERLTALRIMGSHIYPLMGSMGVELQKDQDDYKILLQSGEGFPLRNG